MQTIQQRMSTTGGVTSGWDYLRIFLASGVVIIHSVYLTYGIQRDSALPMVLHGPFAIVLTMFFAVSGFLVMGSLDKAKSVRAFLLHRAMRIFPALLVAIVLTALVLGPALTVLPLAAYFSRPRFWEYFLNITGWIHFYLPGVFWDTPFPYVVNGSLWTIPFELTSYASLPVLGYLSLIRHRSVFLSAVVGANAVIAVLCFLHVSAFQGTRQPGSLLALTFFAGASFYLLRDKIVLNSLWFAASVLLSLGLLTFDRTQFLAVFPIAYATVYLGLCSPPKNWFLMSGDYSYGLYLFAFPIQQTFVELLPGLRTWWANLAFGLIVGLSCAFLSWHLIEKKILARRTNLGTIIDRWLETSSLIPKSASQSTSKID